jgi:hypothetical protein
MKGLPESVNRAVARGGVLESGEDCLAFERVAARRSKQVATVTFDFT